MAIQNTGIVVSDNHLKIALERARGVASTPVMKILGKWLPDEERAEFGDWLDALAQSYGLPAPTKNDAGEVVHYGMTAKGEFTRWVGEDDCPPQEVLGT